METYTSVQGAVPLSGVAAQCTWCGDLERAMIDSGCAVYEEQLLDSLLSELDFT